MTRITEQHEPYLDRGAEHWEGFGAWPSSWVDHPERPLGEASVAIFRRRFVLEQAATVQVRVSADNRYALLLDGEPVGRGPERGDQAHWRFETYELTLGAGEHLLTAMSWWLGAKAPAAQMSTRPGFLFDADGAWGALLSTGRAEWEVMLVDGVEFTEPFSLVGGKMRIDGARFPWGWQTGAGEGWTTAVPVAEAQSASHKHCWLPMWGLVPATLPPMLDEPCTAGVLRHLDAGAPEGRVDGSAHLAAEAPAWAAWLAGAGSITVPPGVTRRAVIDLENYYCVYPTLRVSSGAGATIGLRWAEALYETADPAGQKGHRGEVEGKYFLGMGHTFLPDGGSDRAFETVWWEAGRYVELTVQTAEAPLVLEGLTLRETRYPLAMEGDFRAADPRLEAIVPVAVRAMQVCAHETYFDCPYYEQLMYAGDTRLEVLTTYTMTHDDRLPRKALTIFDDSRRPNGLTTSCRPSSNIQLIPPFSLWWVGMVRDYWLWRDDPAFVRERMPGVRTVLEALRGSLGADGLLAAPVGWNFVDWVPAWWMGIPPEAGHAPSGILNLHLALALGWKAELEAWAGEGLLADRDRQTAAALLDTTLAHFWDESRGLVADDLAHTSFSEHAQCLALLGGRLPQDMAARVADGLLIAPDLHRATIYFSHYLFETFAQLGRGDALLDRLPLWFTLPERGFTTTYESPEPTRSDCHAWGAHPLYHYYASLLGIRPAAPGFKSVRIVPHPGDLPWLHGTLPHPAHAQAMIAVSLRREGAAMQATIELPDGVDGVFVWEGQEYPLHSGMTSLCLEGVPVG